MLFDCDCSFIYNKKIETAIAQVSWRCAGRRPSVRLNGVFLKSEAEQRQALLG